MTREELLARLRELYQSPDLQYAHSQADRALLEYIGDEEVARAYDAITKWYS